MPVISIPVRRKKASSPVEHIVCGNSDYQIAFNFDEEWSAYETKTARFIWNGRFADVVFVGDVCDVPVISNARWCSVGVFAGDLRTTTPALIACDKSILCGEGVPADPTPDVYAQIMELLNSGGGGGADGVSPTIEVSEIEGGHRLIITDVEGVRAVDVLDGLPGKDGEDGLPGADGVGISTIEPVHVTDAPGEASAYDIYLDNGDVYEFNVWNGKDGAPYTLTDADRQDIADAVLSALPVYAGEVEDV